MNKASNSLLLFRYLQKNRLSKFFVHRENWEFEKPSDRPVAIAQASLDLKAFKKEWRIYGNTLQRHHRGLLTAVNFGHTVRI